MNTVLRGLRRALLVVAVAGLTATAGIPTANAAGPPSDVCGANQLDDGVYMRACWQVSADEDNGVTYYTPEAKTRIPFRLNPNGWTACEIHVALFIKNPNDTTYQKRGLTIYKTDECLSLFKYMSENNSIPVFWQGPVFYPQPNYCYRSVTAWSGVYNGSPVDSAANANSEVKCGRPGTALLGIPADGVLPGGDTAGLPLLGLPE